MSEIIHKDKEGTKFKFRNLTFFANQWMILIVDDRDGSMKFENTIQMRLRARAFAAEAAQMKRKEWKYKTEIRELLKCVLDTMTAIKEAEAMGDPTNPEHLRQLVEDRRKIAVSLINSGVKPGPKQTAGGILLPN